MATNKTSYTSYDYKKISLESDMDMQYLDGLTTFGWRIDVDKTTSEHGVLHHVLKRNRNIINKIELTRLEKNFDFCFHEISRLTSTVKSKATIMSLTVGIIGTCFIAGSTFAITYEPPIVWLCVVLAIPGFTGWILPYFVYKSVKVRQEIRIESFIKENYDEIEVICNKAAQLLDC